MVLYYNLKWLKGNPLKFKLLLHLLKCLVYYTGLHVSSSLKRIHKGIFLIFMCLIWSTCLDLKCVVLDFSSSKKVELCERSGENSTEARRETSQTFSNQGTKRTAFWHSRSKLGVPGHDQVSLPSCLTCLNRCVTTCQGIALLNCSLCSRDTHC